MPKPKNPGKLEDFLAPWETKGDDGEVTVGAIKPDTLKKYLHNLLTDKFNAETAAESAKAAQDTAETALTEERKKHESTEEAATRQADEARQAADKAKQSESDLKVWRLEAALEKGLTAGQAARLVGKTKDELLSDADALLTEFGGGSGKSDEGEEDQGVPSRNPWGAQPRVPNDPNPLTGSDNEDPASWVTTAGHSAFVL